MATNFVQEGEKLTTTNGTGSDVDSGGVIVCGVTIRVAAVDIANAASGAAYTRGVFTLAAKSTDTWSDGDQLYWDSTNAELTTTASGNTKAGTAVGAKAATVTTSNVLLNVNG